MQNNTSNLVFDCCYTIGCVYIIIIYNWETLIEAHVRVTTSTYLSCYSDSGIRDHCWFGGRVLRRPVAYPDCLPHGHREQRAGLGIHDRLLLHHIHHWATSCR